MCMRHLDANPGQICVVTRRGEDMFRQWRVEQIMRDADAFGVITYTDYSGYGTGEVVENMVTTASVIFLYMRADTGSFAHLTRRSVGRNETNGRFGRILKAWRDFLAKTIGNGIVRFYATVLGQPS